MIDAVEDMVRWMISRPDWPDQYREAVAFVLAERRRCEMLERVKPELRPQE